MFWSIVTTMARPLVAAWAASSERQSRRSAHPTGALQVHADGADADRLLLIGDGPSVSYGVLSHELGLAGHLARHLSVQSGRGLDLDIVVSPSMTAVSCLDAVRDVDLSRYDAAVLTIGANEANRFEAVQRWRTGLAALLDYFRATSPASLHVFVIAVPSTLSSSTFPRLLAPIVDRQITLINSATHSECESRNGVTFIPFDPAAVTNRLRHSSNEYDAWAGIIAPLMAEKLDSATVGIRAVERANEPERQRSLDELAVERVPDPRINSIVAAARNLFDTRGAAVTFIDHDRQWVKSVAGIAVMDVLRIDTFCDITIRTSALLVVEDAREDSRFSRHSVVKSGDVRFYAGYPIEAPNGRRVGALCVIDNQPREFSRQDGALLRDLAIQVQGELWSAVKGSNSHQNPASRAGS